MRKNQSTASIIFEAFVQMFKGFMRLLMIAASFALKVIGMLSEKLSELFDHWSK